MQHLCQVFQLLQQPLGGAITFLPYRWCRLACDEMNNFRFEGNLQSAEHELGGLCVNFNYFREVLRIQKKDDT